jgi:hypothetical protein
MIKRLYSTVLKVFLLASILVFTGCSRSVDVAADFPEPLLEPLPLTLGVRFTSDLADFTHTEDPSLEPEWEIRLGEANLRMFRAVFAGMFTNVVELSPDSAANAVAGVDLIIEPRLEELEFSVPNQSGTDQYVVWLRYSLKILLPDEQLVSDWRITAYGQKDEGNLGMGSEDAMKAAAIKALRDAGASIAIGFANAPGVKAQFLSEPLSSDTSEAPANSTDTQNVADVENTI